MERFNFLNKWSHPQTVVTEGTASTISVGPGLGKGPTFALSTTPVLTCSRSGPAGQSCKESFYWELFSYPDQAGEAGGGTAGG